MENKEILSCFSKERNHVSALHMVTFLRPNKRGQKGLCVSYTIAVPVLLSHTL